MQVGSLVKARLERGSGPFKHYDDLGVGVVVEVIAETIINFPNIGPVDMGEEYQVRLTNGKTHRLSRNEVEVVSESR